MRISSLALVELKDLIRGYESEKRKLQFQLEQLESQLEKLSSAKAKKEAKAAKRTGWSASL